MSAANVKGHCKSYSRSIQFWSPILKDISPNAWPHTTEKFKAWSEEEKERIFEAIDAIPESLWSKKTQGLYRSSKSKDAPNPATSADGVIVLYDSAFEKGRNLARILSHEMAHQAYSDLSELDRKDYWYSTNWLPFNESKGIFVSRKDGYTQDDGRESPDEDFANNVEFQLFEPDKLEKLTPHAMKWIKKHFGDNFKLEKGRKLK